MSDKYGAGQDPYCYPGTSVLKNQLGLKDEIQLQHAEMELTAAELLAIKFKNPPYDFAYLKTIHRSLFANLYPWAGEIRTVDISKGNTRFCTSSRIEPEAEKIFLNLACQDFFQTLGNRAAMAQQMAILYADLNLLHPFRDGNGRAQRILFEQLALHCDYGVDWQVTTREQWIAANIRGVFCDFYPLQKIFEAALKAIPRDK